MMAICQHCFLTMGSFHRLLRRCAVSADIVDFLLYLEDLPIDI